MADELAKDGAMLDGTEMAQIKTSTVQKKKRSARLCSMQLAFIVWWKSGKIVQNFCRSRKTVVFVDSQGEAKKHRMEWCVVASKYSCMKRGRNSKTMRMTSKCEGKVDGKRLQPQAGNMGKAQVGEHDIARREDPTDETLVWCRKCSGYAWRRLGPKLVNRCRPEKQDTIEQGHMLKTIKEGI